MGKLLEGQVAWGLSDIQELGFTCLDSWLPSQSLLRMSSSWSRILGRWGNREVMDFGVSLLG